MIRVVHPGSRIRILTFYPSRIPGPKRHRIPDPEVKKAPDPGSGSATLVRRVVILEVFRWFFRNLRSIQAVSPVQIRVLLSSSKNSKKILDSYCFVISL
jgi:hypothetical protein